MACEKSRSTLLELAFDGALVDVMVPSADVGEGDLHAEVRLDELRGLAHGVAEASLRDSWRPARACSVPDRRTSTSLPLRRFPCPVPWSTESTDCAYMASKVLPIGAAAGLPPAMPKSLTLLTATAGALPDRMRGREVPSATARKGRVAGDAWRFAACD